MGQSVGTWDGDTLVVTVTGLNDQSWFDRAGNHHSDQLKVVERYTPSGPESLVVRSDHRGSADVQPAMEDPDAAVSAHQSGRAAQSVQVRRVRRRVDVRQVSERHRFSRDDRMRKAGSYAIAGFAAVAAVPHRWSREQTRASERRQAVDDAADGGWQAGSAGHLEQRDDHAARAAGERQGSGAERRGSGAHGEGDRRSPRRAQPAERPEPAGAAEGRRWLDRRRGQRRRLQQFLARSG